MNGLSQNIFSPGGEKLPLLCAKGTDWLGLANSKSPELARRVREFFDLLNDQLGFALDPEGAEQQHCFKLFLQNVYPEVMIDIADRVYVQHERPMVVLNFDHLGANLYRDPLSKPYRDNMDLLMARISALFDQLTDRIKYDPKLKDDPEVVRLLAESYSQYIFETKNFPWEEPFDGDALASVKEPVLDAATGLTGFSLMHDWPEIGFPKLYLSDAMPFITTALEQYKALLGKRNVEVLSLRYPDAADVTGPFGQIWANKFLHHLKKKERLEFLRWAKERLAPEGTLNIVDTDLEFEILQQARDPEFAQKLIPGYLETLVEIEEDFAKHLMHELAEAEFELNGFEVNDYLDETDAYSLHPGDPLPIKFIGLDIVAVNPPKKEESP